MCACNLSTFLRRIWPAISSLVCLALIFTHYLMNGTFCGIRFFEYIYRVSQEERTKLRESVPYVKLYRYNPKHLYPKLNGYGDNGQRKVWTS